MTQSLYDVDSALLQSVKAHNEKLEFNIGELVKSRKYVVTQNKFEIIFMSKQSTA